MESLVSVLTEYQVIQTTDSTFCDENFGLTNFKLRTITICYLADVTSRSITVLHEVFHVLYRRKGIYSGKPYEQAIDEMAVEVFSKLYGIQESQSEKAPVSAPETQQISK